MKLVGGVYILIQVLFVLVLIIIAVSSFFEKHKEDIQRSLVVFSLIVLLIFTIYIFASM